MATTTRFSDLLLDIPYTELCFVEGGIFTMGDGSYDNNPPHDISLSDFWIGRYPVTQALYEAVMGNNPSRLSGKNHPVEQVSWFDTIAFCNKLSLKQGKTPCYYSDAQHKKVIEDVADFKNETEVYHKFDANGYRLPTEAEWEYAAKGGKNQDEYTFSGSDDLHEVGWFDNNSHQKTQPVGLKKANSLGLYDLSGNVWECCYDWYANDYYKNSETENPLGSSRDTYRVRRGGSCYSNNQDCAVVLREGHIPKYSGYNIGFRLCSRS